MRWETPKGGILTQPKLHLGRLEGVEETAGN
jgi:hypothetical protein